MLKNWKKVSLATVLLSGLVLGACGNGLDGEAGSGDVTIT